jgi:shikimate dehydrogenase
MSDAPEIYSAADLAQGGEVFRSLNPPARFAIFGDPIAHSASPGMQNAALQEKQHSFQYVRIHVTPPELKNALGELAAADFLGINITIPHKHEAVSLVDEVSKEALLMGAINTVAVREGRLHGFNTDGPGFATAIREEFGRPLGELRVLILGGVGGAGRAITIQCLLEGSPRVIIANRNLEKGNALAREIHGCLGKEISSISLDAKAEDLAKTVSSVDLIVNATPLGMSHGGHSPLPDHLLTSAHLVYDTVYSGGTTTLLKQAEQAGAESADGFSMLLHQGAKAFEIWFNETAPLEVMRSALKSPTGS